MAEVTRAEFDALLARVAKLEPAPPAVPQPALFLQATPGTGHIDLSWSISNKDIDPVRFLVSRDGNDINQTDRAGWSVIEANTARTRRFDKLVPGATYIFTVTAQFADPSKDLVGTATAAVLTAPPVSIPPSGGPAAPLFRAPGKVSGLRVNLSLFKGGGTTVAALDSSPLGVRHDAGLSFNTRGQGWNPSMDNGLIEDIKKVQATGRFFIVSMPHSMDGDSLMNQKGALDEYKNQQRVMAAYWKNKGVIPDLLVIRLDWEFNGGWYPWTAAAPGGVAALKMSCKYFMENWDAGGMAGTYFDCCVNMPTDASSASWKDLWLGPGYWDILSIDQYDGWPAVRSAGDWEAKQAALHSIRGCRSEANRLDAMWAIAEAGNIHNSIGAGDNPVYWKFLMDEIALSLSPGKMAYWNIYDDQGAPADLFHDWAHNPKSLAYVKGRLATWKR